MTKATKEPPSQLEPTEQQLWRDLAANGRLVTPADLALLRSSLESHQRARRCREAIEKDGEATKDRFGQIKPHPLLAAERDNRAAFVKGLIALGID
jgi:P27 family predicted phage terminase small subunit